MAKLKCVFAEVDFDGTGDTEVIGQLIRSTFQNLSPTPPPPLPQIATLEAPTASAPASNGRLPKKAKRVVHRRGAAATNGHAPEAPAPDVPGRSAGREQKLDQIETFLDRTGSATSAQICRACSIPTGSITSLLKDPRFRKDDEGLWRAD